MTDHLLESDTADGGFMNLGSTNHIDIKTLAEGIRDQFAPELDLTYGKRNDADIEHTHPNILKANELLGDEPTMIWKVSRSSSIGTKQMKIGTIH